MKKIRINANNVNSVHGLRELYESAFPEEEQLPYDAFPQLLTAMPLDFTAWMTDDNQLAALTIVYRRATKNWFWYFAVSESMRGNGLGQQILKDLVDSYEGKPMLIDIESPEQADAPNLEQRSRRMQFYERNGFADTHVGRLIWGVQYTILMHGRGTFTQQEYDAILAELNHVWNELFPDNGYDINDNDGGISIG